MNDQEREVCEKLNKKRLESQKPNIIERAANLINAGVKYVEAGIPSLLNNDLHSDRMRQCSSCTENNEGICVAINPSTGKACGCFIAAKTKVPTEECPVGKWKRVELPTLSPKKGCGGCGSKS
jgi:predicted Zn-ribbon and HTH transcriptional regulator